MFTGSISAATLDHLRINIFTFWVASLLANKSEKLNGKLLLTFKIPFQRKSAYTYLQSPIRY